MTSASTPKTPIIIVPMPTAKPARVPPNVSLTTKRPSRLLASVRVVVREMAHGALASGLVPERISAFLDHSAKWDVIRAACAGHRYLLERLGATNEPLSQLQLDWAMRTAADKGDLRIVQWLSAYRPRLSVSTHVMDSAAFAGHLHVLQWLHVNRHEGCTTHAMDSAAASGHLETVQWLHANRSEGCTTAAMDSAAAGGHLHVLKWLHANRTEGCSSVAASFAKLNGHLDVVQWLHEHRAAECCSSPTATATTGDKSLKRQQRPRRRRHRSRQSHARTATVC